MQWMNLNNYTGDLYCALKLLIIHTYYYVTYTYVSSLQDHTVQAAGQIKITVNVVPIYTNHPSFHNQIIRSPWHSKCTLWIQSCRANNMHAMLYTQNDIGKASTLHTHQLMAGYWRWPKLDKHALLLPNATTRVPTTLPNMI